MEKIRPIHIFGLAAVTRVVLLLVSHYMDYYTHIKFTDIDYRVLTDAARHVLSGRSPFERHTFRYTPFLAYLMVPNVLWSEYFGKLVFVACEFVCGAFIHSFTKKQPPTQRLMALALWFFNPLTIVLSVRGSSDVLITVFIFGLMWLLKRRQFDAAGVLYGLTVHFRVYPVIFCIAFYLYVARKTGSGFFNWHSIRFGVITVATLGILTALFFKVYGFQFLHEAYLYHLTRKDHRHNFSLMFYSIYLSFQQIDPVTSGLLLLVPALLIVAASFRFHRHLAFVCFLTALVFVTYNKVVTAQYFVWFLQFVPLLTGPLWSVLAPAQKRATGLLYLIWFLTDLLWNHFAYRFETLGHNVFVAFHVVNCLFFMVGVLVAFTAIRGAQLHAAATSELRS